MKVSEIFYSLQGEGRLAGLTSVFIRLAGCPLRCRWCDTKYAWDPAASIDYSIEQIIQKIEQWPCRHIVITGGEPMVQPQLPELLQKLKIAEKHITIETAGIAFMPDLPCALMSISPKLSNSMPEDAKLAALHEDSRLDTAVLTELIENYEYQLKFVVDTEIDLYEIEQTIEQIGPVPHDRVMLMPQAATRDQLIAKSPMVAELCKRTGFAFSPRLQILLWNNKRRT